jgi:hypothetical protein
MSSGAVVCPGCSRHLPPDYENADEFAPCPNCETRVRVVAFPALRRIETAPALAATIEANDASCFYHPAKQAVIACETCGRFLCALCDIEVGETHRCPSCLESGKRKGTLEVMQSRRVLYDGLALSLAIMPLLFWPLTIVTAPAAVFLVIRHWGTPLSILPRTRIRFLLAGLVALAQIGGWVALIYFLIARGGKLG